MPRSWMWVLSGLVVLAGVVFALAEDREKTPPRKSKSAIDLGTRRELFVDAYLIDGQQGTELRIGKPHREGIAIQFDKPWEGVFAGYPTVIKDGDLYRLYYRGLPVAGKDGSATEVTCYAESEDGVRWRKPNLGLFEINGSKANNVVLAQQPPFSHNFAPFLDARPNVPGDQRYKALAGTATSGLVAFASALLQDSVLGKLSTWHIVSGVAGTTKA